MPRRLSKNQRRRLRRRQRKLRGYRDEAVADGIAATLVEDVFERGLAQGRRQFFADQIANIERRLRKLR